MCSRNLDSELHWCIDKWFLNRYCFQSNRTQNRRICTFLENGSYNRLHRLGCRLGTCTRSERKLRRIGGILVNNYCKLLRSTLCNSPLLDHSGNCTEVLHKTSDQNLKRNLHRTCCTFLDLKDCRCAENPVRRSYIDTKQLDRFCRLQGRIRGCSRVETKGTGTPRKTPLKFSA